jgi:hypothetical protein
MFKKTSSVVTLLAFLLFEGACVIHRVEDIPVKSAAAKDEIVGVVKTSGEYIQLSKDAPGRIEGDRLFLRTTPLRSVEMVDVKSFKQNEKGMVYEITTKDGVVFQNLEGRMEDGKIVLPPQKYQYSSIPLSEVDMVQVRRVNGSMTFLATVGGFLGVIGGLYLIILLTKQSCPFIYSYDGNGYTFDAEPYGGATSRGLKRTEWSALEHLKPVRGEYRLRITNEVDETQHTDELKLVAVDHPLGLQVVPDESGVFHTFAFPQPPLSARDQNGRDILGYVRANDGIFWQTRLSEKDPESGGDLKDELFFEFPKPAGARQVKLLFNGCSTLWASQMVRRFLGLYGDGLKDYYAAIDAQGPAYRSLTNWNLREELYRLQVRVETPAGWTSLGTVVGGGPFVAANRAYILDLTNIPGDTLRLKLTPPAGFWMINHLAVDYSADVPVRTIELEPAQAVDSRGRDIRDELARADDVSYDAPSKGDSADVTFMVPTQAPETARSLFCKVSGYYDIHMEATGKPRLDILGKFRTEPGAAARYALREYLKWKAEHAAPQPVR